MLAGGGFSGAQEARFLLEHGGHGVVAAVDVDDLAGDGVGEIGEQEGLGCARRRHAGDAGGASVQRAGGDEVGTDALGTEVAGQVAVDRFERGFADANPVVRAERL